MTPVVIFCSEETMHNRIEYIMSHAGSANTIPAPEGLRVEDLGVDLPFLPEPEEKEEEVEGLTLRDFWMMMAAAAERGSDVRNIRESLGMTQTAFAKEWGSAQSYISQMESKNSKLQKRSIAKLHRVVASRIIELGL